jgi:hypothetical protein
MTQEDKELLLKDLSARLPYGVKVESVFINPDTKEHKSCGIEVFNATNLLMIRDGLGEFKPYLFPLSSMTEEIMNEIYTNTGVYDINTDSSVHIEVGTTFETLTKISDILNKYHIDYKGLIPKGLAIDATGKNIY